MSTESIRANFRNQVTAKTLLIKIIFFTDGEPDALICSSCNEKFFTSWALLTHITSAHNNQVYKELVYQNGAQDGATSEDNKTAPAELDVSMEQK